MSSKVRITKRKAEHSVRWDMPSESSKRAR
jgi:hypothetical protein